MNKALLTKSLAVPILFIPREFIRTLLRAMQKKTTDNATTPMNPNIHLDSAVNYSGKLSSLMKANPELRFPPHDMHVAACLEVDVRVH